MNSFNSSFQYLFWIQKKISCEKLNEFVNYINKANWYRNELKNIYNNDDLIPNKVYIYYSYTFHKININFII